MAAGLWLRCAREQASQRVITCTVQYAVTRGFRFKGEYHTQLYIYLMPAYEIKRALGAINLSPSSRCLRLSA